MQLGLLDARHLAGDPDLTAALRTAVLADWRNQRPQTAPANCTTCARSAPSGRASSHYLLEPDLKEARGGLRDATALRAVAASWLADAPRDGLEAARTRLLDARDALHLVDRPRHRPARPPGTGPGRRRPRPARRRRPAARRSTRPPAPSPTPPTSPGARSAGSCAPAPPQPRLRGLLAAADRRARAERTPLAEGVVEHDGEAVLARTARPDRDPVLPLRAAAAAAQAGLPLSTARRAPARRRRPAAARALARRGPRTAGDAAGRRRAHRRRVGGPGGRGPDHPAAARLGARPLPPAAQPRPHLDRRPPPRRDRRPGLPP